MSITDRAVQKWADTQVTDMGFATVWWGRQEHIIDLIIIFH